MSTLVMMDKTSEKNPLLNNPYHPLPAFPLIENAHIQPAIDTVMRKAKKKLRQATQNLNGWQLLDAQNQIYMSINEVWQPLNHLLSVRDDKGMRKICDQNRKKINLLYLKLAQNKKIYRQCVALRKDTPTSDPQLRRVLDLRIQQAELAGIGLSFWKRWKFNTYIYRLSRLQTKFANNLLDATAEAGLILESVEDLQGLPDSIRELAKENYRQYATKHGINDGLDKWRIDLSLPLFLPFMQYADRPDLRESLYRIHICRASKGKFDNRKIIHKILELRKNLAQLLGYKNYSTMALSTRMAKKTTTVYDFLNQLQKQCYPAAKKDFNNLQEYAKKKQGVQGMDFKLQLWDIVYYQQKIKKEVLGFNDQSLRVYFSYEQILQSMFVLAENIFGIVLKKHETFHKNRDIVGTNQKPSWHPDVSYYDVFDKNNHVRIAGLYIDPYSRPQEKRDGAWMNECVNKNENQNPIAYLICNFTPPLEKESLLTFQEVTTLYHEFGHTLQHMLTKIDRHEITGLNGIEWDAVELASQFMENWCYHKPTLQSIGKHYQNKEPIPDSLIDLIIQARKFHSSLQLLRQLRFSLIDMDLHTESPDKKIEDLISDLNQRTTLIPPLPEDQFLCSFAHIFGGSYAAGYYSYKWAEVLSADAFAYFPQENEQEMSILGRKFRDTILALGGSKPAEDIYLMFRGKPATIDALMQQSGLTKSMSPE